MHTTIIHIHILANALFSLMALLLCISSLKGLIRKSSYSNAQVKLEYGYLILLYFGLALGILLYFVFPANDDIGKISIVELQKQHNSQFWAIEHFSVMIFALMLSQIGKIFTSKSISDREKYKYASFYYGIATLIIYMSMSVYLYHKFQ
jgi:hypothetical protein